MSGCFNSGNLLYHPLQQIGYVVNEYECICKQVYKTDPKDIEISSLKRQIKTFKETLEKIESALKELKS